MNPIEPIIRYVPSPSASKRIHTSPKYLL